MFVESRLVPKGYKGITIWPYVLYRGLLSKNFIIHEKIHLVQQKEMLVLPFFVLYFLNYLWNLLRYRFNHDRAYRNIIFEREAYENQDNAEYLSNRKSFQYLRKKNKKLS
jgi:hypothetical protein